MATASEDLIASDEIQESEATLSDDLNCPLCMKIFRSPRRLPCLHSFCHDCLQSHIYNIASVKDSVKEFCCPLCGNVAFTGESSIDKLVHIFPLNTLMLSVLMQSKVKIDLVCNACQAQDVVSPAEDLCTVCEEALCIQCSKMHGIARLSINHSILKIEDLPSKQQPVLENNEMFRCTEHTFFPVEYYCKGHETQLCAKCFVDDHASCPEVIKLANKMPDLSEALNQMKEQMRNLEDQLKQFAAINVLNLSKLESNVNNLTIEIRTLKKIINDALDDLEERVKEEVNKIVNDEKKRIEQINQRCQSQVMAIRNFNAVLESASKYATQNQMFLLIKKITNHCFMSKRHNDDRFSKNEFVTLQLEVNPQLNSVINIPRGEIGTLRLKKNGEIPVVPDGFKPLEECLAEHVNVKDIKGLKDKAPIYSKVIFTGNEQLLLVDYENKMLYLLDSLCNIVCSHTFLDKPFDVCIANEHGEDIAAVSLPYANSVHLFSLKDNLITYVKQIQIKYKCFGIAAYNHEELVVSGPCDGRMAYYWSIITLDGKEKSYHEFNGAGTNQTYVALNAFKSRLYISVWKDDSLHCFGLNGTKHFTFRHLNLKESQGVSVDRDDNVYVVGERYRNIFQLSSGGLLIRIIVNETEKSPMGICFDTNGDKFVLCHGSTGLGFYQLRQEEQQKKVVEKVDLEDDIECVFIRVQLRKEKKFLTEAIRVMEENGEAEEAAKLLLVYGKIDQAEVMARKTLQENTIAQTLLVCIQVLMSRQAEARPSTNDLKKTVKEVKELFKSCKNIDGFAEANLLLAELAEGVPDLTESLSHINQAWNDFLESKPFVNLAGTLECVEWIVTRKLINKDCFMSLIRGFDHLFKVVQILCCPKTPKDKELLLKYYSFFGLSTAKPDYVIYYPKQKPRCKDMIQDLLPSKQERRKVVEIEIEKKVVNERIALYLLNRAKGWLHCAVEEVTKMRKEVQQCLFYQVGLPCPGMEKQDGICPNLHYPLNKQTFDELMEIDRMFIELQRNIEFGARNLRDMCPASLTKQVEFFLHYNVKTSHEDVNSFTSCEQILQDLMPMSYHPFVLSKGYPSEVLRKMDGPVKDYMKAFMEKRWKEDTGEKIFRTTAARSANVFLMVEFCSHLFSIDFNFDKKLREFETALRKEQNQDNKERKYSYLALMTGYESINKSCSTWIVESLARRFYDSYYYLTKPAADPMEAIIKFTKFVAVISKKAEEVLPDPKFFLMWLEFYTTLSFFLIAKINKEMKRSYQKLPDVSFFVPASYLHLMDFIEATFPKQAVLIQKAVSHFAPRYNSHSLLQDRLDHIVIMVCGTSKSTSLVNVLFSADLGTFFSCAMAERVLVLAMTLVSNVGTFISVKSETALMQALTQLRPPEKCPKRLRLALEAVQKAQCIRDVGAALRDLLKEREEENLMSCKWVSTSCRKDQIYHVQSSILTDAELLPGNFLAKNTLAAISHGAGLVPELLEFLVDHEDETQMSMEEKMKWQIDAAAWKKAQKEAGMIILRLFRRISFSVRCRDLKARVEEHMVREEMQEKMKIFETARVTDIMCGICNVSFEWLREQSVTKQVSDSFTIGKTNATPDFGDKGKDFGDKGITDAIVGVDLNFEEQKFTPESQNDVTNQEENSKLMSHMKSLVPRFYDRSGEKSNADITSKGEINKNNNAALGESNEPWYHRLFSYESSSETVGKEGPTKEKLKELRARELKKIKEEHIQSQEHMLKQLEFHSFKKLFKEKIEPKCKSMQEYILKYELGNAHFRNYVYSGMQLEINRILICMNGINFEMSRILHQRSWNTSQALQQLLGDMVGAYNAVHLYVDESYRTYIQRQEEQKVTTPAKIPVSENWVDEFEDVVDDPAVKVKSEVIKGRRRWRSRKN